MCTTSKANRAKWVKHVFFVQLLFLQLFCEFEIISKKEFLKCINTTNQTGMLEHRHYVLHPYLHHPLYLTPTRMRQTNSTGVQNENRVHLSDRKTSKQLPFPVIIYITLPLFTETHTYTPYLFIHMLHENKMCVSFFAALKFPSIMYYNTFQ